LEIKDVAEFCHNQHTDGDAIASCGDVVVSNGNFALKKGNVVLSNGNIVVTNGKLIIRHGSCFNSGLLLSSPPFLPAP
jgi:uncharacterized Zn-binding protein involved in type VI secretion